MFIKVVQLNVDYVDYAKMFTVLKTSWLFLSLVAYILLKNPLLVHQMKMAYFQPQLVPSGLSSENNKSNFENQWSL